MDVTGAQDLLLKRIKKHDMDAVVEWFGIRKDKYYRMGWSYLYNSYDIEDVFHGTIIKVYDNIHQLREERYFETWATSIFINECKKVLRERKRSVDLENLEESAASEDTYIIEIKEHLINIEEIYREVIILKYISGYSQEEIAELLNIPIGTVKTRIYRGLKLLRKNMKREELE
ncbi:MAG: polymerase, sigma-24 subunit, subfamily [Clostridiales bacterium]|jgi:RNA polymerase sigma-70 factor (ECF subfamily)|nr:polymerase, sigma-24 subunit, subfamily [Clostridiales bacterium]